MWNLRWNIYSKIMFRSFVGQYERSEARHFNPLSPYIKNSNTANKVKGFTLIEFVLVIIILGIMSVGIAGFITLSTQTYLNVTERDELLANARFVVERLNREIRNALPNSLRLTNAGQCLEFTPIIESTTYTDIPVAPETARNTINVIKFDEAFDTSWNAVVYPLNTDDVYGNNNKVHGVDSIVETGDEWVITLDNNVLYKEESPTQRIYFINGTVEYCLTSEHELERDSVIMAEDIYNTAPFVINDATLQRNAMIQIKLNFMRGDENIVFNNETHIVNVP